MGRVLRAMKKFLSYLRGRGIVNLSVERFLIAPAAPRKKVLPCLSEEEISGIFSSISAGRSDFRAGLLHTVR